MRTAHLLSALLATGIAAAQQLPMPAFASTYTAPLTRGFWFQAPVDFVIAGLRVPDEAAIGTQVVEVIDLGTTPPPAFPGSMTGTQRFFASGQPSGTLLTTSIAVQAGHYIGILGGCGTTTLSSSFAAPGTFAGNVFGYPMTLSRFGTQTNIHTAGGNQPCWSEPAGSISRVEVHVSPTPGYAYAMPLGHGCYDQSRTFYEAFPVPTNFDLAGRGMQAFFGGNQYVVLPGGSYVPPTAAASLLALGDDTQTSVTLTNPLPYAGGSTGALTVCSNGYVSVGAGNGTGYQPNPTLWLQSALPRWGQVHDYNPAITGSGQVKFEEVGTTAYLTWDGVYDFGTTGPGSTFQLQFDTLSGNVTYVFVSNTGFGNGHLVGYAAGGSSRDLGNLDLTATLTAGGFSTGAFDLWAPSLFASARPRLGASLTLDTADLPLVATLGAVLLGLTEYTNGLSLAPLGMPGCSQFASADATVLFFPVNGQASLPMTIPSDASFTGVTILAQSVVLFQGTNPTGAMVSNGLRLMLLPN